MPEWLAVGIVYVIIDHTWFTCGVIAALGFVGLYFEN